MPIACDFFLEKDPMNNRRKIVTKIRQSSYTGVDNAWHLFPSFAQDLERCHIFLFNKIRNNKQKFSYSAKKLIREVLLDNVGIQAYFSSDHNRFEIQDKEGRPLVLRTEETLVVPQISDEVLQQRSVEKIKKNLKFVKLETDVQKFFADFELVYGSMIDEQKKVELKRFIPFADREEFNIYYAPGSSVFSFEAVKNQFITKYEQEHRNHRDHLKNLQLSQSSSVLSFIQQKLDYYKTFEGQKEPDRIWSTLEDLVACAPFLGRYVGEQNADVYKKEFKFIAYIKQLQIGYQFNFSIPFSDREALQSQLDLLGSNSIADYHQATSPAHRYPPNQGTRGQFNSRHQSTPSSSRSRDANQSHLLNSNPLSPVREERDDLLDRNPPNQGTRGQFNSRHQSTPSSSRSRDANQSHLLNSNPLSPVREERDDLLDYQEDPEAPLSNISLLSNSNSLNPLHFNDMEVEQQTSSANGEIGGEDQVNNAQDLLQDQIDNDAGLQEAEWECISKKRKIQRSFNASYYSISFPDSQDLFNLDDWLASNSPAGIGEVNQKRFSL